MQTVASSTSMKQLRHVRVTSSVRPVCSLRSSATPAAPAAFRCNCTAPRLGLAHLHNSRSSIRVHAEPEKPVKYNTEFGYSRKDVLLIGAGFVGVGYGLYYGLQAAGFAEAQAGLYTQLVMVLILSFGWVSTYLFRVATKQMTYTQQLQAYEEAVMKARLKEMTEEEVESLMSTVEAEKQRYAEQQQK